MLNGFESHWLLFKIFKNGVLILKKIYRVSNLDLNRTKYSMLQEFDVNLDLTAVISLKKSPTCSPDLNPIKHILKYKYHQRSKTFSIWWV